jgi:hypothetical protein
MRATSLGRSRFLEPRMMTEKRTSAATSENAARTWRKSNQS